MPLREDILNPIPGDNPSGKDLRYAPIYDKIKEARREDDDLEERHFLAVYDEHFPAYRIFMALAVGNPLAGASQPDRLVFRLPGKGIHGGN